MVIAGAADVLVDQDRRLGRGGRGVLAVVLQDGGDRAVGAGAENQRAGASGIDPLEPKRLTRPIMPMQERNPCSGCGRERMITSTSTAVSEPINAASRRMRSWVQSR